MTLSFLLKAAGIPAGTTDTEVSGVTDEPGEIKKDCVFVCISGARGDGHVHAAEALQKGAAAVIGEKTLALEGYFVTQDSRLAYAKLCSAFFGDPGKKLKLVGVTGTNGKTTTAEYIRFLLENTGHRCGLIGTSGCVFGGRRRPTGYTTPGGAALYGSLADMAAAGCEYCVMEVSSQALAQKRADALRFTLGIFTNLGSEHLDYHKTVDAYAAAKARLASLSDAVLVNHDDAYAERFVAACGGDIRYYSARNGLADYMANNIRYENGKISYVMFCQAGVARVSFRGIGEFGVYNSLAAAAACVCLGIPFSAVTRCMEALPQIPGRAQTFTDGRGVRVCVDFAHTPDALSNVLLALSGETDGGIITVFGCGGDRDAAKRPLMGRIAANMSKTVILTSDNPRSENVSDIIGDIKRGIKRKADVFTEPEREKAIRLALNKAEKGDTVLIAGKGDEKEQIFPDGSVPFSDIECVKNILGI